MIDVRYATADDLRAYLGSNLPRACRAVVAIEDGKVLGFAGVAIENARQVAFMDLDDSLRKHPRVFARAAKLFMPWVRNSRLPTHALCDESIEAAVRFLEHHGFRRIHKGVFQWQTG